MADKGESEVDIEVYTGVSKLQHTIEELGRKIDEMLVSAKSSKCGAEMKALSIEIRVQKNNQERVKKRFDKFMTRFCQSHDHQSPEVFMSSDEGFEELKETIEGFEKEEDDMKERIDYLMVKFGKSRDSGDSDVGVWTAVGGGQEIGKDEPHFLDMGIKGMKIREEFYQKPGNPSDSADSDVGFWISDGFDVKEGYVDKMMNELVEGHEQETSMVMSDFEEIDMKKEMGLEGKMLALMQTTKVLFKKDQDVFAEKSLIKWIEDFEDTTGKQEWTALKKVKVRAVELGADVCRVLGDLMFRLSEKEEVLEKFQEFKSALESLTENRSVMVTKRLTSALEIVDDEIRKREEVRLGKKKSAAAGMQTDNGEKKLKKNISEESPIEKLLLKFYLEVYRLDSMLNSPGLPQSKVSPPPKTDIKQYEKVLKQIDKEVTKLKKKSYSIFESEVLNFDSFWRRVVEMKINDQWGDEILN